MCLALARRARRGGKKEGDEHEVPEDGLIVTYFSELIDLRNSLPDNRQVLGENILPDEPRQKAHDYQLRKVSALSGEECPETLALSNPGMEGVHT